MFDRIRRLALNMKSGHSRRPLEAEKNTPDNSDDTISRAIETSLLLVRRINTARAPLLTMFNRSMLT